MQSYHSDNRVIENDNAGADQTNADTHHKDMYNPEHNKKSGQINSVSDADIVLSTTLVNIYEPPKPTRNSIPNKEDELIVGDLHANVMKLCHFLLDQRILELDDNAYMELVRLYQDYATLTLELEEYNVLVKSRNQEKDEGEKSKWQAAINVKVNEIIQSYAPELVLQDLGKFLGLLDQFKVLAKPRLHLLGDELSDRGACDFFILSMLRKFKAMGITFDIILSNHSISFIECFEKEIPFASPTMSDEFTRSLLSLEYMIKTGVISRDMVDDIVEEIYLPALKLINAKVVNNEIIISSHAPIDIDTIESYANKFNIAFKDNTPQELLNTIDEINKVFQRDIVANKKIHKPYDDYGCRDKVNDPIGFGFWNRDYSLLNRSRMHKGYYVAYVHGHDSKIKNLPGSHCHSLDSPSGKNHYGQFNDENLEQIILSVNQKMSLENQNDLRLSLGFLSEASTYTKEPQESAIESLNNVNLQP